MPSGAKKRKAAKRRKEQASRQITKSNHGNVVPKSQEERVSDDSVSSPASHDNEDNPPFKTNNEPAKEDSRFREEDSIKIERELKPEEKIEITDSGPEQDKGSSSSSSSWEDDSREIEKKDNKEAGDAAAEVIAVSLSKQAASTAANAPIVIGIVESTAPRASLMPAEPPNSEKQIQIERLSEKASVVSAVNTVNSSVDEEKSLPNANQNVVKGVSASHENRQASTGAIDPIPETNGVAEGAKESEVPISHETEAPLRPPLGIAKRTSWFSCCGLFDVITGSRT